MPSPAFEWIFPPPAPENPSNETLPFTNTTSSQGFGTFAVEVGDVIAFNSVRNVGQPQSTLYYECSDCEFQQIELYHRWLVLMFHRFRSISDHHPQRERV